MLQQSLGIHPLQKEGSPAGHRRWIGLANAEAMAHARINMEFGGYVETAGQDKVRQTLRDVRPVVASAGQESAGCLRREPGVMGDCWIQERLKVWFGTARSTGSSEEGTQRHSECSQGSQLAAGGEPHDSNARWIDSPFLATATHGPDGTLHIRQFGSFDCVLRVVFLGQPVLQDESRDAMAAEPFAHRIALVVHP